MDNNIEADGHGPGLLCSRWFWGAGLFCAGLWVALICLVRSCA